jgi:hypothetical protein
MIRMLLLLAAALLVGALSSCPAGAADGPVAHVEGVVAIRGQTVLLYQDRVSAENSDDSKCRNLGSYKNLFLQFKAHDGFWAVVTAANLGDPYARLGNVAARLYYVTLRGRRIEQWCDDRTIYWAEEVKFEQRPTK